MNARADAGVESRFERALREIAGKKRRLDLDAAWRAMARAEPELTGSPSARAKLRERLDALAEAGVLALPTGRKSWDASVSPPLPLFVTLVASREVRAAP